MGRENDKNRTFVELFVPVLIKYYDGDLTAEQTLQKAEELHNRRPILTIKRSTTEKSNQ